MGNLTKAAELYEKSLKISRIIFGENNSNVTNMKINLGYINFKIGKFPKALKFYKELLKTSQDLLGENHPVVAILLNNLGLLYKEMCNYPNAEECYLNIYQNLSGERHSSFALSLGNLGTKYHNMGNPRLKSWEIYKNIFGESHSEEVAAFLNNLASIYSSFGDFIKAEEFYSRSLNIRPTAFWRKSFNCCCFSKKHCRAIL